LPGPTQPHLLLPQEAQLVRSGPEEPAVWFARGGVSRPHICPLPCKRDGVLPGPFLREQHVQRWARVDRAAERGET